MKSTILALTLSLSFLFAASAQQSVEVVFTNHTNAPVTFFWVDGNGKEIPYGTLQAGDQAVQQTYFGHTWNWRGSQAVGQMIASAEPTQYITLENQASGNCKRDEIKVRAVSYVDPGTGRNVWVQMTGNRAWAEYSPNGTFTFEEKQRDEWSVYLYDRNRGMSLQIDLYEKTILYGTGDASSGHITELFGDYPIASASN